MSPATASFQPGLAKVISPAPEPPGRQRMKRLISLCLAGAGLLCGCSKQAVPPPAPAPQIAPRPPVAESPQEQPALVPPPPAAGAPVDAGTPPATTANYLPGTTAFDDLSRHLAWFVISKKRFPVDVDELLTANRLPKPALPPGGRLVINKEKKTVDYVGPR